MPYLCTIYKGYTAAVLLNLSVSIALDARCSAGVDMAFRVGIHFSVASEQIQSDHDDTSWCTLHAGAIASAV